jgi:SAM-dependent methyltransferase
VSIGPGPADLSVYSLRQMSGNVINGLARQAHDGFQQARAELFLTLLAPKAGATILDLGGGPGVFAERVARAVDVDITVADILDHEAVCTRRGFKFLQLSEGGKLPLADHSYDIVLCNSVIEHVTLSKADCVSADVTERQWKAQAQQSQRHFADEIRRVGRQYFVQTPHRSFPIDVHMWLPFTHWLPHRALQRLVPITDRFWIKRCSYADWNLLDTAEMRSLFPDCSLHVEKFFGLPKSLIAYKRV